MLGLLADGPMHGHQIRRAAELAQIERWENVKVGALYGMLKRLAGEGLIEPVRSEQEGRFPVRTVYGITDEGRLELALQRERALTAPDLRSRAVEIALTWSAGLAPAELRDQLGRRRASLQAMLDEERARRDAESRKRTLLPAAGPVSGAPSCGSRRSCTGTTSSTSSSPRARARHESGDRGRAPREALRRGARGARRVVPGRGRRGLRAARPERRRQVHDHADAGHPDPAERGPRARGRPRRPARGPARALSHRLRRPGDRRRRPPQRTREPPAAGPGQRPARRPGLGAGGRAARAPGPERGRRPPRRHLLGRDAAPRRARDGPRPPPERPVPGRADDRSRSRGAGGAVGRAAAARARGRADDPGHHPLDGGGRAAGLEARRGRRRQGRRRGHARGAAPQPRRRRRLDPGRAAEGSGGPGAGRGAAGGARRRGRRRQRAGQRGPRPRLAARPPAGLEEHGIAVAEAAVSRPTLDDVYLHHTGHALRRAG